MKLYAGVEDLIHANKTVTSVLPAVILHFKRVRRLKLSAAKLPGAVHERF